jgi:hypothetical protein
MSTYLGAAVAIRGTLLYLYPRMEGESVFKLGMELVPLLLVRRGTVLE